MKKYIPTTFVLLLALFTFTVCLAVAPTLNLKAIIPSDTSIIHGNLDNGLEYYIRHDTSKRSLANIYLYTRIGMAQEDDGRPGYTHFTEHVVFRQLNNKYGLWTSPNNVKFNTAAYTKLDYTVFSMTNVDLSVPGNLSLAIDILKNCDNLQHITGKDIMLEKDIITEEIRQSHDPINKIILKRIYPALSGTKYTRGPLLGTFESIGAIEPQNIISYHKKWYRPDNQVMVITTSLDPSLAEKVLRESMSAISTPSEPLMRVSEPYLKHSEPQILVLADSEIDRDYFEISFTSPASAADKNNTVGALRNTIIREIMMRTLSREFVPVTFGDYLSFKFELGIGQWKDSELSETCSGVTLSSGGIKPGRALDVLGVFMGAVESLKKTGISTQSIESAKKILLYDIGSKGLIVPRYVDPEYFFNVYRNNLPFPSKETDMRISSDIIASISANDVNSAFQQMLNECDMSIFLIYKSVKDRPEITESDIMTTLERAKSGIQADKAGGAQTVYPGMKATAKKTAANMLVDLKGGKTVKTESGIYNSTILTLNNGIRVVMRPTESLGTVNINAKAKGGIASLDEHDRATALLLPSYAAASGFDSLSPQEVNDIFSSHMIKVDLSVDSYVHGFESKASERNIESLLKLIYLKLTSMRFDRDKFLAISAGQIASADMQLDNWDYNVVYEFEKLMNSIGKYPGLANMPNIGIVEFERLPNIYRALFGDPTQMVFTITGKFDPDTVKPYVEKYLGSIPVNLDAPNERRPFVLTPGIAIDTTQVVEKRFEIPRASVTYAFVVDRGGYSDATVKRLTDLLAAKLYKIIRWDEGLTYALSVDRSLIGISHDRYLFKIKLDTDPRKVDRIPALIERAVQEIADNKTDSVNVKFTRHPEDTGAQPVRENGQNLSNQLQAYFLYGKDTLNGGNAVMNSENDNISNFAEHIMDTADRIRLFVVCR